MPQKEIRFQDNPGMTFVISFVIVAILNSVVVTLANSWFPSNIVMGTISLSTTWAAVLFGSTLSLLTVLFMPFITTLEQKIKRGLAPFEMMLIYFAFNFISVWLLTRKSEVFGVGVTSWIVVLILALVLDVIQGMVMMRVEKWRT